MNERLSLGNGVCAVWVVTSGVAGYACLAYGVLRSHGGDLLDIVNRLLPGGV